MSATTLMLSRPTDSPTSGVGSAPLQMPEDMDYGAARFGHPYDTPMVSKAPTARTAKRRAQDHDAYDSMPIKHPATAPAATSRSFFGDSYATTGPPSEHIPMDALGLPFGTGKLGAARVCFCQSAKRRLGQGPRDVRLPPRLVAPVHLCCDWFLPHAQACIWTALSPSRLRRGCESP